MTWGDAEYLWLLTLTPLVSILIILSNMFRKKRLARFLGQRYKDLSQSLERRRQVLYRCLALSLAFACICIALARPRWGYEWRTLERKGADIMVVVDVSKSMNAEDIKPNRLQRARREIIDLLSMLQGDRIGLLQFAGVGFVQCPLTLDYMAMELFLDSLGESMIPVPGSAIGNAIRLAHKSLMESATEGSVGKSIILITDGEDHESGPIQAAQDAASDGVRIYPIGIGSEGGAPIPDGDGGYVKDQSGRMVLSRLDEGTLEEIARITEGRYVRSTTGDLDLDIIYSQHIRKDLKPGNIGETREKVWHESFWIFAVAAMFILIFDFHIQGRRLSTEK
ncbi:vWA domain-containing protein [Pseudobacteriovorax antillogorgiicola]|uniref:Ca-activated chloride channel family protein n=1 Tax=Pseudobacteriovorax antillogorgiicola TaxID=1513793 RepID=A0A1Y6BS09_9BACT|nr:VWA domain-containing protein [Pseudobacteriovorax antillogorgiicola]TCS53158.1 Ca-activated chloride channel family protein [Pseudobacteriovorax antillogorgiicola]SMF25105.1 Ca-activated chloride channel family protein [Pseudobacteriovorax antillogorgiicola]